ncbi:uncharacterized protein C20orf173 homolog isoform X1 [Symphalangus syndactylus]|uniref:uncharacterized protein C20orf173 homolog isoform X1 n=1 Tax=Symphalangus syndactylus TaxID=9590 RepID=UPI002441DF05|nr:uncharacterized protein C20orf173 homolog isoform X1 [Symphalangus syndactylus]
MQRWQIFVLWVFWVLILWLMTPYLDPTPESAPQEKRMYLVPRHCNCPWFSSGKCGCPSETLNCSSCHHTADEWNWLDVCSRKAMGYLMRTRESMNSDTVLWWLGMNSGSELGKLWRKLFKGIPRLSVSHFDFHCGTCVLLGCPQIPQGSSLGNDIDQYPVVFRNASDQGSWMQLEMLLWKLSDLVWTSDALSDEVTLFGFGSE